MADKAVEQSIKLIKSFVHNILDDNIKKLKDFSFLNLNTDIKYRQDEYKDKIGIDKIEKYGGYFIRKDGKHTIHQDVNDYDDMNITRAINYLLYANKINKPDILWNDLNWEYTDYKPEYKNYNYRGETINTFNTLINDHTIEDGNSFYEKFFNYDKDLIKTITEFRLRVFSIGNFMLLPNNPIGSKSLNTYKGLCLGDYADRFFKHILNKDNEYINKLLLKNDYWYNSFKNNSDIEKFINDNYLQDYFDDCRLKKDFNFAPYYAHWFFDKTPDIEEKEIYTDYIRNYIKIVKEKIDNRADKMIKDLILRYPELIEKK